MEFTNLARQNGRPERWKEEYSLTLDRQFGYLVNGFSATMPASQMTRLALEPGVASVRLKQTYTTNHPTSPEPAIPASAAENLGLDGTSMVISIIDTGLNLQHLDLRLDDCGKAKIKTINLEPLDNVTCKVPTGYDYVTEGFGVASGEGEFPWRTCRRYRGRE